MMRIPAAHAHDMRNPLAGRPLDGERGGARR